MAIEKINFSYPEGSIQSVYDGQAITALQLAGITAHKVDECIELVNGVEQSAIEATDIVDTMKIAQEQFITENNDVRQNLVIDNQTYLDGLTASKTQFETDLNNSKTSFETELNNSKTVFENNMLNAVNTIIENAETDIEINVSEKINAMATDGTLTNIIDEQIFSDIRNELEDISINVKNYGAIGDGITNDTLAIKNAIIYASSIKGSTLLFPKSEGFLINEPLVIPPNINVVMESPVIYDALGIAITIGDNALPNFNCNLKLNVVRKTQSDWTLETEIGIKLINPYHCKIDIVQALHFTIGVQYIGIGTGCSYNTSNLRYITNNKYDIDLTNGINGWCNENLFLGGRFTVHSDVANVGDSYAVRITSTTAYLNNCNIFLKPSVEGKKSLLLCEHGSLNVFENCRKETTIPLLAKFMNKSALNKITTTFDGFDTTIIDETDYKSNVYTNGRYLARQNLQTIFALHDIHLNSTEYNDTYPDYTHVKGALLCRTSGGVYEKATLNLKINSDFLEINSCMIGAYIDTTKLKNFVVSNLSVTGYGGRAIVICYDENNVKLGNTAQYVKGDSNIQLFYSSNYGGCWQTGSDVTGKVAFRIEENVKKIFVGFGSGSQPLRIKSLFIETADKNNAFNVSITPNEDKRLAIKAPTGALSNTQFYKKGTIIYNDNPVELGVSPNKYIVTGWTCITEGSAGTWVENRTLTGN
jgi:hypothetical protein